MSLESGTKLGPYEILSLIGAGGMGEVYKAKDTRLDRTVAIKVLPSHLAESPERRERFEREARAVSSLNHPHICTLHDIGEQDGTHFLVMEYIDGETLADRLKKGSLPLDQALRYGIEIADALDKAHRQGVVHRDLKPGNIMITKPGAKLLDFGLAKLKASEPGQVGSVLSALPTEQKPLTKEGSILGTFQYMAPEQLEGEEADARTDIFTFGSVLYEMVTGKRTFEGKSQASLISSIMKDDPPTLTKLQPMTPPALDHVVKTCLAKDPDERWQTASDLGRELKWIADSASQADLSAVALVTKPRPWKQALIVAVIALVTAAVTGFAVWGWMRQSPQPVTRFAITIPGTDEFSGSGIALSRDGRELVYLADRGGVRQLFRRPMNRFAVSPISGSEGAGSYTTFFSPDGEWVGFFAEQKLKKIALTGGPPVTLCDAPAPRGASWGDDDTITFSLRDHAGLLQVRASGGEPHPLTDPVTDRGELRHFWPDVLPGGKAVLFTVMRGTLMPFGAPAASRIAVQSLETGEVKLLVDGTNPRYVPTGHIVFANEASLWAVPFDAEKLELIGSPTPIIEGVQVSTWGRASFGLADDGSLVYVLGEGMVSELVWVDREGRAMPLIEDKAAFNHARLSPDGRQLAVDFSSGLGSDIWIYDIERGTRTRLTSGADCWHPVWTPDGKRITFNIMGGGHLLWTPVDGSFDAETLLERETAPFPTSWSPDGGTMAFEDLSVDTGWDIWMLPLDEDPQPFINQPFNEKSPIFSPDGNWLAYISDESGRDEIYVQPYPGPGGKVAISRDGGREPLWSPDGRELFYRNGDQMMVVAITTDPVFTAGKPNLLFEGSYVDEPPGTSGHPRYDITPDGQQFVMIRPEERMDQLLVVVNWLDELKRLVPVDN